MPANFPPAEKPNSGNVSLTVLFDVCEMFFDAFGAVATEKSCIDLGSTSLKDTGSISIFTGLPQNTSQKQVRSPLPFSICSCRKKSTFAILRLVWKRMRASLRRDLLRT